MTISRTSMKELLDRALEEPLGLRLEVTDGRGMMGHLQRTISFYGDDSPYRQLMTASTPDPNVIFIIKKSVELE